MRMFKVESKNIEQLGFDPKSKQLDVVFVNAPQLIYTYYNIGMIKFVKLLTAESIGGYFEKYIRSKPLLHPFTKVSK